MRVSSQTKTVRTALMGATALGCSLVVMTAASAAVAADQVITETTVTTTADATPGIAYSGAENTLVTVDQIQTSGAGSNGIDLQTSGAVSVISGAIATQGDHSFGMDVIGSQGPVSVTSTTISTEGQEAYGMRVVADGDVTIHGGDVTTTGYNSQGVLATAYGGHTLDVDLGVVRTEGYGAQAVALSGSYITLAVDAVTTTGNLGGGVRVDDGIDTTIDIGSISTSGEEATGIVVQMDGTVNLEVDSVDIGGSYAMGVWVRDAGTANVKVGTVTTAGLEGAGITVSATGDIVIDSGVVTTQGNDAVGIDSISDSGVTTIDSVSVSTGGDRSTGIRATGYQDVTVRAGTVSTSGTQSDGIYVVADPNASLAPGGVTAHITATSVETQGDYARGVFAVGEDVIIDVGDVATSGTEATGILVEGSLNADVTAQTVTTTGNDAYGIQVYADETGVINVGSVETEGDGSTGVYLNAGVSGTVVADSIVTEGAEARGVWVRSDNIDVTVGNVETTGSYAEGVYLEGLNARAKVGTVRTEGQGAVGVRIEAESATLEADLVATSAYATTAVEVYANTADVKVTQARTSGDESVGVLVSTETGGRVEVGDVTTEGSDSNALEAIAQDDESLMTVVATGLLRTTGVHSYGALLNMSGPLDAQFNQIKTEGDDSRGLRLIADGAVDLSVVSIETLGDYAIGFTFDQYGDEAAAIDLGAVNTAGEGAHAISVAQSDGTLNLTADTVATTGDEAHAVVVSGPSINLDLGAVSTAGYMSNGVRIVGDDGDYVVKAASITVTGEDAAGVVVRGRSRVDLQLGDVVAASGHAVKTETYNAESITLRANSIVTEGVDSNGALYLYADRIDVGVESLVARGDNITGVYLSANPTLESEDIYIKAVFGSLETTGDDANAFIARTSSTIDFTANTVITRGRDSTALTFDSTGHGTALIGSILTEGDDSGGLYVERAENGFDLTVQGVETKGENAYGVWLDAVMGDTTMELGTVRTAGASANGVLASITGGDLELGADDVRTLGADATAIDLLVDGDAALEFGYVDAAGAGSDGVVAEVAGDLGMSVTRRLGSASGVAGRLTATAIDLDLAATAVVAGGTDGLVLESEVGSVIDNAGSILTAAGHAIRAVSGSVTLNNTGAVRGRISFTGADDVINNSGLFETSGVNEFGAGQDVFNNAATGIVALTNGATPMSATFANLEQFNNAGTIDLANGVAGDSLNIPGVLNSTAGSKIQLDLDMTGSAPVADQLNVGQIQGASTIQVQVKGFGSLGDTGVVLVDSAGTQTGQEFTVETLGGGFLGYDLDYDSATGGYSLIGDLAIQAYEPTKVASGAQTQWRKGADVVAARLAELRDSQAMGGQIGGAGRGQVWAQAFGGEESLDGRSNIASTGSDLGHDVTTSGVQIGADVNLALGGGSATVGGLVGAARTKQTFDSNGDTSEYESTTVGVYGQWTRGIATLGAVVKGDFHDLTYRWASADMSDQADGETWGATVNASMRLPIVGAWFAEPDASVSWNTTELDGIEGDAGAVDFGDTESLVGRFGLRGGTVVRTGSGVVVQPFAGLHLNREFDGDNVSTLSFGSTVVQVEDKGRRTWAEGAVGVDVQTPIGLGAFVQVEGLAGDIEGYAARVGARFSW